MAFGTRGRENSTSSCPERGPPFDASGGLAPSCPERSHQGPQSGRGGGDCSAPAALAAAPGCP
eukprot:6614199-Pyramimonas_sp.AAC.1